MRKHGPAKCDLCEEDSIVRDSWFNTESCKNHENISPIERQKLPVYWDIKKSRKELEIKKEVSKRGLT